MKELIDFTRINNDANGNPRFVCHFLNLVNDDDRERAKNGITGLYDIAIEKAKKIGGKKYHNKSFGGGIVFKEFDPFKLQEKINELQKQ